MQEKTTSLNANQEKIYQNDFNLLRKFDLEKAKDEELLCSADGYNIYEYLGHETTPSENYKVAIKTVNSKYGTFLYICETDFLRMKPLCWVEGKPVYKGDILWYFNFAIKVEGYNPHVKDNSGLIGKVVESRNNFTQVGEKSWTPFSCWSWDKPKQKVKRKVWINVYPEGFCTCYESKDEAEDNKHDTRIACVETEIEYEV